MKKTHTKAFANLIASILLLCIEGWALFQTYGFKVVKKATVQPAAFPQIMCVGMIIFTVILLIQSIIKLISMSDDDPLAEPAASINFVKNKAVLAGLFVILLCSAVLWRSSTRWAMWSSACCCAASSCG